MNYPPDNTKKIFIDNMVRDAMAKDKIKVYLESATNHTIYILDGQDAKINAEIVKSNLDALAKELESKK